MITEYTIENFKAFASPATVPIKPITLIFGPNSSGKSSLFQPLLMLKQTWDESTDSSDLIATQGNLVNVGDYSEFIYNHSYKKHFKFSFKVLSNEISMDLFSEKLKKTINCDTMGLSFTFFSRPTYSMPSREAAVTKIDLLIGNNPSPLVSYKYLPPTQQKNEYTGKIEFFTGLRVYNLNYKHDYWKNPSIKKKERDQYVKASDWIQLINFLPNSLNKAFDKATLEWQYEEDEDYKIFHNISLVTLSLSWALKKCLNSLRPETLTL